MKKNGYLWIFLMIFLLASCRAGSNGEETPRDLSSNNFSGESALADDITEPAYNADTEPVVPVDGTAELDWFEINSISVALPVGWFHADVDQDPIKALAFANQDLRQVQLNGETVDEDTLQRFIKGALVVSPLPAGSDPVALRTGLASNLGHYTSADLEGMLFVADSIGLINLLEIDNIILNSVVIGAIDDIPALVMSGSFEIIEGQDGVQSARVWLTWTDSHFVSFYEIANASIFEDAGGQFDIIRQSIQLN
jgi:hypothetical protein